MFRSDVILARWLKVLIACLVVAAVVVVALDHRPRSRGAVITVALATTTTAAPTSTTTITVAPVTTTTAPAPAPAPRMARRARPATASGHLDRIRACESGGDYASVSSTGKYRGAYQFSRSTWDGNAARAGRPDLVGVDPALASPADQDAMALALYEASGPGQWPVCQHR